MGTAPATEHTPTTLADELADIMADVLADLDDATRHGALYDLYGGRWYFVVARERLKAGLASHAKELEGRPA